jgi:hypothetical protein
MTGMARRLLLVVPLVVGPAACFDDLRGVGPGVRLTTSGASVDVAPGSSTTITVQVVDVNDAGVDGARVTFTRTDASRLTWLDAPLSSDAITVTTAFADVGGVTADGVARARIGVPKTAAPGDATIVAVLKVPADPDSAITTRVTIHVASAEAGTADAGAGGTSNGGKMGQPGAGGAPSDASTGVGGAIADATGGTDQ